MAAFDRRTKSRAITRRLFPDDFSYQKSVLLSRTHTHDSCTASIMARARLSPTANLLRNSRLFSLPPALTPPQDPPTSRTVFESDTATLHHPIRAAIVTPASSLARGDWGLKRPLPAQSTSGKSSRPVVRVKALDTYEHVTDFESAADHTVTLEKFQELHMPMSMPDTVNYSSKIHPRHQSPFESLIDNTESSQGADTPGAKRFRQAGPWLAGLTEAQFNAYLAKIRRQKPDLLQKLREHYTTQRNAEARKIAQDNGEDLESLAPVQISEEEFQMYIKTLRSNPSSLGPVVFNLLDLPSPPPLPSERMNQSHRQQYYHSPGTKLSSPEYAISGPPKTHPSAGLSYVRTHAALYNHPLYGPQSFQRPVEARILRPKGKFKGRVAKAIAAVAGIVVEDLNAQTFKEGLPPGFMSFDGSIPGGAKYWATPIRAYVDSEARINLSSLRASVNSKLPYEIEDHKKPENVSVSEKARGANRQVPPLDLMSPVQTRVEPRKSSSVPRIQESKNPAVNLMNTLGSS